MVLRRGSRAGAASSSSPGCTSTRTRRPVAWQVLSSQPPIYVRTVTRHLRSLHQGRGAPPDVAGHSKQKLAFNGNVQDYCWCYSYFITNPEAAWDFHVYPNNNWMTTWSYAATNRVLFQAGVSLRQDRQFNGVPAGDRRRDAVPRAVQQGSPTARASRRRTVVGDTEYGDMGNQYAYQSKFIMSYVTGSHSFKVGMPDDDRPERAAEHFAALQRPVHLPQRVRQSIRQGAFPHSQHGRLEADAGRYMPRISGRSAT